MGGHLGTFEAQHTRHQEGFVIFVDSNQNSASPLQSVLLFVLLLDFLAILVYLPLGIEYKVLLRVQQGVAPKYLQNSH